MTSKRLFEDVAAGRLPNGLPGSADIRLLADYLAAMVPADQLPMG